MFHILVFFFKVNVESSRNCIVYLFTNHVTYSNFEKSLGILLLLLFSYHFFSLSVFILPL